MKRTVFKCDQCKVEFIEEDIKYALEANLDPLDAFSVTNILRDEEYHYCSAECLIRGTIERFGSDLGNTAEALENIANTIRKEREKKKVKKPITDITDDDLPF